MVGKYAIFTEKMRVDSEDREEPEDDELEKEDEELCDRRDWRLLFFFFFVLLSGAVSLVIFIGVGQTLLISFFVQ